jgi:hypothetical protein
MRGAEKKIVTRVQIRLSAGTDKPLARSYPYGLTSMFVNSDELKYNFALHKTITALLKHVERVESQSRCLK